MKRAAAKIMVLALIVPAVVSGCASRSDNSSSSGPSPTPSAVASADSQWKAQAEQLGALLASFGASPWSYEPRGDLPKGRDQTSLVFIELVGFRDHGKAIAFDAMQWYQGDAATREAKKDGGVNNSDFWVRNRYRHVQVLPLYENCPIAVHDTPGGNMPVNMVRAVSAAELAKLCSRRTISSRYFWMFTDGRFVYGLVQQYV